MAINLCNRCHVFEAGATCTATGQLITVYMPIANYNYSFWITDKFGNYWVYQASSWGDFHIDLDLSGLPEGMSTEYSGTFEVTVSESSTYNQPVPITIDGIEYDCFLIKFVKTIYV